MKWSDVGDKIREIAGASLPALGTALGGPAGAAIGVALGKALGTDPTPDAVAAALNPDAAVKLREIEADLAKAQLQADTSVIGDVNATMQSEAKSDHWPTYTWRPAIGFSVAFNVFASSLLVLGVFAAQVFGAHQAPLAVNQLPSVLGALAAVSATALPILGVASYFRGKMQADPRVPTDNRG